MNIVVAFTLEAFLLEYATEKTKLETKTERRIRELDLETKHVAGQVVYERPDGEDGAKIESGVRFKLVRGMTGIDDLLEKMFVGEIQSENKTKEPRLRLATDYSIDYDDLTQ